MAPKRNPSGGNCDEFVWKVHGRKARDCMCKQVVIKNPTGAPDRKSKPVVSNVSEPTGHDGDWTPKPDVLDAGALVVPPRGGRRLCSPGSARDCGRAHSVCRAGAAPAAA